MKKLLILISIFLCATAPSFANSIAAGKYVGKWRDDGGFRGKFTLSIEVSTDKNIAGTIQIYGSFQCRRHYPFDIPYTGGNQLSIAVDTQTNCGTIRYVLDHDNGVFNGKFQEVNWIGKVMDAKLQ